MRMVDEDHSEDENEDISQVVELLRRVRNENLDLKRNFESLKAIHLQLVETHQQLDRQHAGMQEERVKAERQYQVIIETLRNELDDRQRELDAVRAQVLKPREVECLRVKLLEELEEPYKLKCHNLNQEAEAAAQKLVQLQREHDAVQAAFKSLETRSTAQSELQAAEHLATVTQLKDRLAQLGNPQAKLVAAETQLQQVSRERDSLSISLAKLQDEIADVRRQKERAVVEKEAVVLKVERKMKDIQEEEVKLHGLVESLTRKSRHMQAELTDAHRANEEQHGQLMKAQADKSVLHEQLESLKKASSLDRQALVSQYEDTIHRLEEKLECSRKEVHERERQVADLHLTHQEQVGRLVEAHEVQLSELQADAAEKSRQWREQRNELQAKLETMTDTCQGYRGEVEGFKRKESSAITAARREADRLKVVADEAERHGVGRSMEVQQLKQEMDALRAETTSLELSLGHATRRKEELEALVSKLEAEATRAAERQHALTEEAHEARSLLEAERVQSLQHIEAARRAAAVEKAALAKKYQASLHELVNKHRDELKHAKKRLRHAQKEVAQLMEELTELRFRSHDLQTATLTASGAMGMAAMPGCLESLSCLARPASPQVLSWSPGACSNKGVVSAAVLADLAALKERQQAYLSAIEGIQTAAQ